MLVDSIGEILNLDKSRQSTLRNYVWALKNGTNKYKMLAQVMHVDGEYLCLNTTLGYQGRSGDVEGKSLLAVASELGIDIVDVSKEEDDIGVIL
jgi:hypothetical protein